ncbi:VWA domain-containing protein, partial [Streptomyces sp. 8N706]|uniref:VWA domain-containing protein n=1 Tax=Streptomyces sp. 8N706 TaxID=3457416 RepID=UPI003FCF19FA
DRTLEEFGGGDDEPDPDGPGGGGQPPSDGPESSGPQGSEASREPSEGEGPEPSGPEAENSSDAPSGAEPPSEPASESPSESRSESPSQEDGGPGGSGGEQGAVGAAEPFRTKMLSVPGLGEGAAGRRSRARTAHGRTTGARRPQGALTKLHLAATVQAAAPYQHARGRRGPGLVVRRDDLRQAVREGREGNLVLFVVDASGSMAARQRMGAVKGAVLSLLLDAYQRRDKVGLVTFRGTDAELALPPTSSVEAGAARLESLPTGGRTPLAAGLLKAHEALRVERLRDPSRRPLLVVVTDGRATASRAGRRAAPGAGAAGRAGAGGAAGGAGAGQQGEPVALASRAARLLASEGTASVVVDCESGPVRLGLAGALARDLGGTAVTLDELRAESMAALVRDVQGTPGTRRAA